MFSDLDFITYREEALKEKKIDVTPKNGDSYPWKGQDLNKFEREWGWKPVTLRGYFDYSLEIKVEK